MALLRWHAVHALEALFRWQAIAVVGASESSSYGAGPFRALREVGFDGRYYPVNPRRAEVQGVRAYPDVRSLPGRIDIGVLAVGRDLVLEAAAACADQGARAIVVISAGFGEADARGTQLQAELTSLTRERDLLLVGPNCFGLASLVNRVAACTATGLGKLRRGNVGVVSHSGGLLNEIISFGAARQVGFSHLISTGNEAGITASDVLDFYVDDPSTQVILAVLESVRAPAAFVTAAERAVAARKPLVVLKLGASERAARSAMTHTGALAGSDEVYSALFRQKGFTRVADIDELIEVGSLFSGAIEVLRRRPLERAAVIEISGGGSGLVSDTAAVAGVELPEPSPETIERLTPAMPRGIDVNNPLDTGLSWGVPHMASLYPLALDALAQQPDIDVVVSRYTVPREGPLGAVSQRLSEMHTARAAHPDRLYAVLSRTSDRFSDEWATAIGEEGVVFLQGYERGMRALGSLARYCRFLRRRVEADAQAQTRPALVDARPEGGPILNEVQSKDLLRQAGLPVIETTLARTVEEALADGSGFGYPVVLKVVSPEIVHKSDAGGVRLGLADEAAVRTAFADLQGVAGSGFLGVAVQPMASGGVELALGGHRDPQFGPVVLFGLGGVFVEVLRDVALRVAPLSRLDATDMLDEIRGRPLLEGARGQPPVDRQALVEVLCQLGDFLLARPWIESVDLNPVLAGPRGLTAVDARVVLSP
jgi:acyl-CoA synthetase (NDP forming)